MESIGTAVVNPDSHDIFCWVSKSKSVINMFMDDHTIFIAS